jgi:hypothetical protein
MKGSEGFSHKSCQETVLRELEVVSGLEEEVFSGWGWLLGWSWQEEAKDIGLEFATVLLYRRSGRH